MTAQLMYNNKDTDILNRKRFDSVATNTHPTLEGGESDFTTSKASWQQKPTGVSICEAGRQRTSPRPTGLPFDCWNSPLCPRNLPQDGAGRSDDPGQTICNPGASLNNNSTSPTTHAGNESSCNAHISKDISIPVSTTPPPDSRPALKRARTDVNYESGTTASDDAPAAKAGAAPKEKRLPHHVIERRYRENLNTQIEALRTAVPSTSSCITLDMEDIGASATAAQTTASNNNGIRPLSKAGVIAHAAGYMRQLAVQNDEVERRNAELRMTVEALRRLVNCEGCGVVQQLLDAGG